MTIPDTPGWRLWLSLLISGILACGLSIAASVVIADRNASEQLRRVAIAKEQATAEQRRGACQLVSSMLTTYQEIPGPMTAARQNVIDAWLNEYRIIGCLPRK